MKKIVIGLSGGMDSATLLGLYLDKGYEVHCCNFQYGSKHNSYESEAVDSIYKYYLEKGFSVYLQTFYLEDVFVGNSALLKTGEAIPEGHYNDENMKKTVVPGRNLILASIMAGLAESIGAEAIALGVHSGDHHIYPDCRPGFMEALSATVMESSEGKVDVYYPMIYGNKKSILETGLQLDPPVPYHLTRTCYKDQKLSCGKCGSCQERLEAFGQLNLKDPIQYE